MHKYLTVDLSTLQTVSLFSPKLFNFYFIFITIDEDWHCLIYISTVRIILYVLDGLVLKNIKNKTSNKKIAWFGIMQSAVGLMILEK